MGSCKMAFLADVLRPRAAACNGVGKIRYICLISQPFTGKKVDGKKIKKILKKCLTFFSEGDMISLVGAK